MTRCKRAGDPALEFGRTVRQKRLEIVEEPDPVRIGKSRHLKQHAFNRHAKFNGMSAFVEERIIVPLEGVPTVQISRESAYTAGHRTKSIDIHYCGVPAGESAQGSIRCRRINCAQTRIVIDVFVVVAKAGRIHEASTEAVSLLDGNDLPRR